MRYTITGRLLSSGTPADLTWENGELSGEGQARLEVLALAESLEGRPVGATPTGPFTDHSHLLDPLTSTVLLGAVFAPGAEWSGEVPELPAVPDGAVA